MRYQRWIGSLLFVVAINVVAFVGDVERAHACTCLPPTVESSYNQSTDVFFARVDAQSSLGDTTLYLVTVERTFKGCAVEKERVLLSTPSSSASCGALLDVGETYLINGDDAGTLLGLRKLGITLCDYNVPTDSLSKSDRAFLEGRTVCCGGECECADGSQPVQCFVDPCEVAPPCDEGQCVANYCGGCNAEFYDDNGYAVCQDDDCRSGECGARCETSADCEPGQYCAADGLCDDDGLCELDVDCNLDGNDYPHIECVGYGVCEGGRCGWECDNPQCLDLDGYDFGPCDAVLGWGVIGDRCQVISGCSSEPFELFPSEEECRRSCETNETCMPGEVTPPDECGNICTCSDTGKWLCTQRPCIAECRTDADCMATGCSGQICAAEPVITTCEWRPEYACYQDPEVTTCGCTAGRCGWDPTDALSQCLEEAGTGTIGIAM